MAITDQTVPASRTMHQDDKGMTGHIAYRVEEADIFDASLPTPGSAWPGPGTLPYLRCVEANWTDQGAGWWLAEYEFSTERELAADFVDVDVDGSVENLDTTKGWTWETAGTAVEQDIPTAVGVEDYRLTVRIDAPIDYDALRSARNKVNSKRFHGYEDECLLFENYRASESYTLAGEVSSASITYLFRARDISHNYIWREPLQDVDAQGNGLVYQNKDSNEADTYTTDSDLIGTKVYVSGAAGTAGWDKPVRAGNYRYQSCDFAEVLGLPKNVGDE